MSSNDLSNLEISHVPAKNSKGRIYRLIWWNLFLSAVVVVLMMALLILVVFGVLC